MKALLAIIIMTAVLLLAGCAGNDTGAPSTVYPLATAPSSGQPPVVPAVNNTGQPGTGSAQMANPASVNCINKGGKLYIVKDASGGEIGMCDFGNGTVCEEWAFMRGSCPAKNTANNANAPAGNGSANANNSPGGQNRTPANANNGTAAPNETAPAANATAPANNSAGANATVAAQPPTVRPVQEIQMYSRKYAYNPDAITVKKGTHVILRLTSIDVSHSLLLPAFGVNTTISPLQTTIVAFDADQAGTFTYRCATMCDGGEGQMMGTLTVTR